VFAIADTMSKFLSTSLPIIEIQWIRYMLFLGMAATMAAHAPARPLRPHNPKLQLLRGFIGGYLVFDNLPDRWTLVGATIIVASGLYTAHRERIRALP
jgi:drug/metabolite transporter (DMT)-like permease